MNKYVKLTLVLLVISFVAGILLRNWLYADDAVCRAIQSRGADIACIAYPFVNTVLRLGSAIFIVLLLLTVPILYIVGRKK